MVSTHYNNFGFLRLLFALFVIITHSYTLTGVFYNDGLYQFTGSQITFSRVGLCGFFTISGYLIFESLNRSISIFDYFRKRILRIYPALIVVLILTAIGFSLLSKKYSVIGYFTLTSEPYTYILKNLMPCTPFQGSILDTIKGNPYPHYINGSIWTIRYEFLFYIALSSLFFIKKRIVLIQAILISIFLLLYFLKWHVSEYFQNNILSFFGIEPFIIKLASQQSDYGQTGFRPAALIDFGLFFTAGALLSAFNLNTLRFKGIIGWIAFIIAITFIIFKSYSLIEALVFPVVILTAGLGNTKWIGGLNYKIGDLSYGVYIYGFVIQQVLLRYFELNHLTLTWVTMPLALFAGFLSWNLIEKRAMKLKVRRQNSTSIPLPA
ncbi:peptidoglycan/LPS O-acetylase OafA/YrhL [Pontibacter ummariensis]|uniref:Peptidoglycan/LPS O-acetylase OafA/YrhL, contains acyltransferase and SGNH-hydrolase domains n=1 Tax=Pontibacter ummariensis TaxID=1610492 RepID=A0A239BLC1_9BACT|nr:acyltransferase [Pontibacter ummariensis]PRY15770.1 peptidoglycan/LPS O-acetylase OafA/YrhL [Pontibacter ummariensis]SNS08666.1 Peptidoglycan/LPS O-acetylase OafA/YrhL, contains acyltransferase and SGNH-hydrolase domains [Pontibacter ummariensis]